MRGGRQDRRKEPEITEGILRLLAWAFVSSLMTLFLNILYIFFPSLFLVFHTSI